MAYGKGSYNVYIRRLYCFSRFQIIGMTFVWIERSVWNIYDKVRKSVIGSNIHFKVNKYSLTLEDFQIDPK